MANIKLHAFSHDNLMQVYAERCISHLPLEHESFGCKVYSVISILGTLKAKN